MPACYQVLGMHFISTQDYAACHIALNVFSWHGPCPGMLRIHGPLQPGPLTLLSLSLYTT